MKWLLVFYMGMGSGGGPDHIEFKSKEQCEAFLKKMNESFDAKRVYAFQGVCLEVTSGRN